MAEQLSNREPTSRNSQENDLRLRIMLIQEPTTIPPIKDSRESPRAMVKWLDILNLDNENIAGLGAFNLKWTGQIMDLRQIDILDVFGAVIVLDLATGPVYAFNFDGFAGCDLGAEGNIGMPPVLEVISGIYTTQCCIS
jgi:hypothetical protein